MRGDLNSVAARADQVNVAKKKSSSRNGALGVAEHPKALKGRKKASAQAALAPAAEETGDLLDIALLRESVGRGSLAEQVLDSLELAMGELRRAYGEVAALGKSLALAREQLVEQEDELEMLRDSSEE